MPVDFWLAKRFGRSGARKWVPKRRKRRGGPPFVEWWVLWFGTGLLAGGLLRDLVWRFIEVLK